MKKILVIVLFVYFALGVNIAQAKNNIGNKNIFTPVSSMRTTPLLAVSNNEDLGLASATISSININDLPVKDAYKAIVKIKTFHQDENFFFKQSAQGSGVIIDPSGILLTNYHVITEENDFDGTLRQTSFQICIPEDVNQEPECSYTAEIIARDKNLDMALLKIKSIAGISTAPESHVYLSLSPNEPGINDEVIALGYPGIGGETITVTKGIVSGKSDKYDNKWLKTDAVISFGSSGGAALNSQGRLMGITSAAHSDLLGSLGYIITSASIQSWVNANKNNPSQRDPLAGNLADFTKAEKNLKGGDKFKSNSAFFSITKKDGWEFNYISDEEIQIVKKADEESGSIDIAIIKYPYLTGMDDITPGLKRFLDQKGILAMVSIIKEDKAKLGGLDGKLITLSIAGQLQKMYLFPSKQNLIKVVYGYGKGDKDKGDIEQMLSSFAVSNEEKGEELHSYVNANPVFSINAQDWYLMRQNEPKTPVGAMKEDLKQAFIDIGVEKINDELKSYSNDEYLNYVLQTIKDANKLANIMDFKGDILSSSAHAKINGQLMDAMMIEIATKIVSTGETLVYEKDYFVKSGDKMIMINFNFYGDNGGYSQALKEFNQFLIHFNLGKNTTAISTAQNLPGQDTAAHNAKDQKLNARLKGKIVLKVEDKGAAYYVNPKTGAVHYLGLPKDAFKVMREQGIGVLNKDLDRIPVSLENLSGTDSDKDGLPDAFEDAVGTDKNKPDTDGDGFNDKVELSNGYTPLGAGKLSLDKNFSDKQKGKIFLETEKKGEAWYINPQNGKKYFLGKPDDAYHVMKNVGVGITNSDFEKI